MTRAFNEVSVKRMGQGRLARELNPRADLAHFGDNCNLERNTWKEKRTDMNAGGDAPTIRAGEAHGPKF